jgi:hypothetical protein
VDEVWRAQFKAMRPEDVVRLKALEKETARLKRIVGDQALDIRRENKLTGTNSYNVHQRPLEASFGVQKWLCSMRCRGSRGDRRLLILGASERKGRLGLKGEC